MGNTRSNNIEEQKKISKGCYDHKIDHFKYEVTFEILNNRPFKWLLSVKNQNNDIYSLQIDPHTSKKISPYQNPIGLYDQLLDSVLNPHPKLPKFRLFFIPENSSENGDIHLPKRLSTDQVEYFRLDSVHQKKQMALSAVIEIHQMGAFKTSLLRYFVLHSQKRLGEKEIEKIEKKNTSLRKTVQTVEKHRIRARKASERIRRTLSYVASPAFLSSHDENSHHNHPHHHHPIFDNHKSSLSFDDSMFLETSFNNYEEDEEEDEGELVNRELSTSSISQDPERILTLIEGIMKEREKFALEKLEWERKKYISNNRNSSLNFIIDFFRGTHILTRTQQKSLNRLYGRKGQEWKLLYSAEKHGWKSYSFHQKCDGYKKGGTMIVVKSRNGSIFGGFTQAEWSSNSEHKYHPNTWLYSLETTNSDPPRKLSQDHTKKLSIYCNLQYGPTFGGVKIENREQSARYERKIGEMKHDLFICSDAHQNIESYADPGICFVLENYEYGNEKTRNFLNEDHHFMPLIWNGIFQLEVFVPVSNI